MRSVDFTIVNGCKLGSVFVSATSSRAWALENFVSAPNSFNVCVLTLLELRQHMNYLSPQPKHEEE